MNTNNLLDAINHYYYGTSLWELKLANKENGWKGGPGQQESGWLQGLSYHSFLYLNVIYDTPNCTISRLSELLHVSKSAVTMRVNELVKQGILTKTRSLDDKRVVYITLSEELADIYLKYDTHTNHIAQDLRKQYSEEELELFCRIMHSLAELEAERSEI